MDPAEDGMGPVGKKARGFIPVHLLLCHFAQPSTQNLDLPPLLKFVLYQVLTRLIAPPPVVSGNIHPSKLRMLFSFDGNTEHRIFGGIECDAQSRARSRSSSSHWPVACSSTSSMP